jgi:hypothetical protein
MLDILKTDEPLLTAHCLEDESRPPLRLGQAAASAEAMTFLSMGYKIEVSRFNGSDGFSSYCNYMPGDM